MLSDVKNPQRGKNFFPVWGKNFSSHHFYKLRRNAMKNKFYLNGIGQLHSIEVTDQRATVCIAVQDTISGDAGNGDQPDQITLECQVSRHLIQRLQRLKRGGRLWEGMTVRFRAIYDRFGFRHAGQCLGDPLNLLGFQCQLDHITVL
jgi:hypothetical protein